MQLNLTRASRWHWSPTADAVHQKENISLIRSHMGLAILPPRLKEELKQVQDYLLKRESTVATYHQAWADDLKATKPSHHRRSRCRGPWSVNRLARSLRVLEDVGVYKRTVEGQAALTLLLRHFKCGEEQKFGTIREKTRSERKTNGILVLRRSWPYRFLRWTAWSMKDRKSSWSIAWSCATVQRHPDAPSFTAGASGGSRLYAHCFSEHADIDVYPLWGLLTVSYPWQILWNISWTTIQQAWSNSLKSCMNVGYHIVLSSTAATYAFQKKFRLRTTPQNQSTLMVKVPADGNHHALIPLLRDQVCAPSLL